LEFDPCIHDDTHQSSKGKCVCTLCLINHHAMKTVGRVDDSSTYTFLVLWGNLTNNSRVFKLQKKVIRIILGVGPRDSCRSLFKKLDILPLSCKYIFSLTLFVIDNQNNICSGSEAHGLNTRSKNQFYIPTANLSVFQKGTIFTCIRLFNFAKDHSKS
jgi:hypothetical protein